MIRESWKKRIKAYKADLYLGGRDITAKRAAACEILGLFLTGILMNVFGLNGEENGVLCLVIWQALSILMMFARKKEKP